MTRISWPSSASLDVLKARATMYAQIRSFFNQKGLLEVETPLLSLSTATDPYLSSFSLSAFESKPNFYLQTSPEFPMKRLLASFGQAIFQICKTFRKGESGQRHNPEFSMLEWYQPNYSLDELMQETISLIELVCGKFETEIITYRDAFIRHIGIDPFKVDESELNRQVARLTGFEGEALGRLDSLDLLLSHVIEPKLGKGGDKGEKILSILTEYPSEQASLAKVKTDKYGNKVAERFEVYIEGLEIANAYHELTDAIEQRVRFEADNDQRRQLGLPGIPLDENLLAAMENGLPACSGIALGLDRLLMIKLGLNHIDEVLSFPIDRA